MYKVANICLSIGLLLFSSFNTVSSQPGPQVVNSAGGHINAATMQLDYSVGEIAVMPFSNATSLITVGVLQPDLGTFSFTGQTEFNGYPDAARVMLNWNTPASINYHHFDIERSADGISFSKLLSVNATADATFIQNYRAVDPSPFERTTYYRLKQVGGDGTVSYSKAIAIVTAGISDKFVVSPNPFAGIIFINSSAGMPFSLKVVDMTGRVVSQHNYTGKQVSVDLSMLAKGMYILQLYANEGIPAKSIKITKQ